MFSLDLRARSNGVLRTVVDTNRGSRRVEREQRNAAAGGGPTAPRGIFDPKLLRSALPESVRKLDPRQLIKNPVMFVVEVTAALVTLVFVLDLTGVTAAAPGEVGRGLGFELQMCRRSRSTYKRAWFPNTSVTNANVCNSVGPNATTGRALTSTRGG